ncbi:hypothetical protein GIB67_026324 [Kingdonia uniflora]|uniref:non-specific serine/threonine protein kinase n=1 Tax=Kingdonia uniflora TaxID=39325 RepID=A0A7J7N5S0_9MAGN|nr:hypothetical protein GIB67_026324 [Kingdonia uniflora]
MPSRPFSPTQNPNPAFKTRVLFLSIIISASVIFLIALLLFLVYLYYFLLNRAKTIPFDANPPLKLQKFTYKELKSATNVFNGANFIGKGGSGTVFRGILRDGKSVAVKKLDVELLQAEREFQNELEILGELRSPFVVTLLGYCVEKNMRFLVYEYMPNKSLQESLFGEGPHVSILNWDHRFDIILDIARALAFLHLECDPPVLHGDIKPSNVLLGLDYRAKVSDFGLSRVKTEGEFGVGLFSQELGQSQELSRNLEADFASSSSKINRVDCNGRTTNSNSRNYSVNMYDPKCCNQKGKKLFTVDIGGEDWNRFVPYDDEYSSIEHSKELSLNALSPPNEDPGANAKQWGKDWWWRQDGSGELCSKDYVTEWIGSQICPPRNPHWDEENRNSPLKSDLSMSSRYESPQYAELGLESSSKNIKSKKIKDVKNCNKKHMKMQEWWKKEHLEETKRKDNKLRKIEAKLKKRGFKIPHFDLGRKFRIHKNNAFVGKKQSEFDPNVEFSFRKGSKKKKKTSSAASEKWSGDLFSRELSSTTSMRGTVCYVAPEYGGCGHLLEKADIYSFGVLILVVISGRRPLHILSSPMTLEKANLISWCRNLAQTGNVLELVDEKLKGGYNKDQAVMCINVALMCLQKMPELRPDIGDIVKIFKGEMDLPSLPFEFSPSPSSKLFSRSKRRAKADVQ